MKEITGTGVALVTPFDKELRIDFESLEKVIEHVVAGNAGYVVALGTTSESPTLTQEEKTEVAGFITGKVNGRVPVVLGIGNYSTQHLIDNMSCYDIKQFSALLLVTPYYNKPGQNGLYEHYSTIAKKSPVPLILYNVPGRTGVNMAAETTLKLARNHRNIAAIKEASGNLEQIMNIINDKPENFEVISGDDSLTFPLMCLGAKGVISVTANSLPGSVSAMVNNLLNGNIEVAREIHYNLLDFNTLLFTEGNPAGIKCALSAQNLANNVLRLPLTPASDILSDKITRWLENNSKY